MHTKFSTVVFVISLNLCLMLVSCKKPVVTEADNWEILFNGQDLTDWIVKINGYDLNDNYNNTFRVENGSLVVSYDHYDNFTNEYGHIFYKKPFKNYRLKLEYRFIGNQVKGGEDWAKKNSGIMLHSQSPVSMLLNQGFPLSLEFQLLGGIDENEPRPSGNLCTPATNVVMDGKLITDHCITANCETFYGEEWINAEVLVLNDSITHYINGKAVISYSRPTVGGGFLETTSSAIQLKSGEGLTSGYISLQSESHPIEFKNIKILEL